jgi:hypothetical protein
MDPVQMAAALAAIASRVSAAPFGVPRSPEGPPPTTAASAGIDPAATLVPPVDDDARVTEPSMPAMPAMYIGDERRVELRPAPPSSAPRDPVTAWSSSLAPRVDAARGDEPPVDEWGHETPVIPPTTAELRALFGHPDPTRQLPVAEAELLQRRAAELTEADRRRRPAPPTAEVDPDDIEAAIELAPPARRPVAKNTIGVNRPKKTD